MQLSEVLAALESTGFPVASHSSPNRQKLPYICYLVPYEPDFIADNINYVNVKHVQIELYTAKKDEPTENALQLALTGAGFVYAKSQVYIETERMFQTIYEVEV